MADSPRRITKLSAELQNLVTSPVHIVSLNDVILELVKNSLDARADNIEVRLDLTKRFCSILDNGCGILHEEFLEDGGLAKLHYTSKADNPRSYGRNGCFLASLANVSVLSISSADASSHVAHTLVMKDGERIASGNTTDFATVLAGHRQGTRVTVHDLFGKLPVRVRYARQRYEREQELEKDYNTLKLQLAALLLASEHPFSIHVSEESLGQQTRYRVPRSVRLPNGDSFLDYTISVLSQLSYLQQNDPSAWRTASLQTPNMSISAAFGLYPQPTRSLQFISIGQNPVKSSVKFMYDQINSAFERSGFGAASLHSALVNDTELRAPTTKQKAASRWPMYNVRIDVDVTAMPQQLTVAVGDALRSLATEFLEAYQFGRAARPLTQSQGSLHQPRPQKPMSGFDAWSRIKSAKGVNYAEFVSGLPFVETPAGHTVIVDKATAESKGAIEWTDVKTGRIIRINPRTGAALPDQPSRTIDQFTARVGHDIDQTASKIKRRWTTEDACEAAILSLQTANFTSIDACPDNVFLNKGDLRRARVLGQIDNKFVLAISDGLVFAIDQHAADERVKLEDYFAQICKAKKTTLPVPIQFEPEFGEVELCERARSYLSSWGVDLVIKHEADFKAAVCIAALPDVIAERCRQQPEMLVNMLRTELWTLHEAGVNCDRRCWDPSNDWLANIVHCPQGILGILVSRACRSAIMFNDVLTIGQAKSLVERLAACSFPFQCAHGRPSMNILARIKVDEQPDDAPSNFGRAWMAWETQQ